MKDLRLNLYILNCNNAETIYNLCKKDFAKIDLVRASKKIVLLNDSHYIYKMMLVPGTPIGLLINALYSKRDVDTLKSVVECKFIPLNNRISACRMIMKLDNSMNYLYDNLLNESEKYVDNVLELGLVNIDINFGIDRIFLLQAMYKNEIKYLSALIIYEDYLSGFGEGTHLDDYYSNYANWKKKLEVVLKK